MRTAKRPLRVFRCFYHPCSRSGAPIPNDTGILPSVQVAAVNTEEAERIAHAQVGFPITETQRLDDVAPPKPSRKKRQARPSLEALGLVSAASLLRKV